MIHNTMPLEIYRLSDDYAVGEKVGFVKAELTQDIYDALHDKMLIILSSGNGFATVTPFDGSSGRNAYVVSTDALESYFNKVIHHESAYEVGEIVAIDTNIKYSYCNTMLPSFTASDYQDDDYVYAIIDEVHEVSSSDMNGNYYNIDYYGNYTVYKYRVAIIRSDYSTQTCMVTGAQLEKLSEERQAEYKSSIVAYIKWKTEEYKEVSAKLSKEVAVNQVNILRNELQGHRRYPTSNKALRFLVGKWFIAKNTGLDIDGGIMGILSKHPNWNPESFSIEFDTDWSRDMDNIAIMDFRDWIAEVIDEANITELYGDTSIEENRKLLEITKTLRRKVYGLIAYYGQLLNEQSCNSFDYYFEGICNSYDIPKFHDGAKYSKSVNKFLSYVPVVYEHPDYNKEFAKFSNAVNPLSVKRHTRISLNPIDFFLQSYGNSWRSCHYIDYADGDIGCYSSGTISYMLDNVSFVLYTSDASLESSEVPTAPRITRCMYAFDGYKLLQQRLYPAETDGNERAYDENRAIAQRIIAECMGLPNMWTVNHNAKHYCVAGENSRNYHDWNEQDERCSSISILKDAIPVEIPLTIGAAAYDVFSEGEMLTCGRITNYFGCRGQQDEYTMEDEKNYDTSRIQFDNLNCFSLLARLN